jgi:hypothetical protein
MDYDRVRASLIFWSHQIPYLPACFTIPTQPAYHFRWKELRTRHQHNTPNLGKADAISLHPSAVRRHRKLIARVFFSFSLHTTVLATFLLLFVATTRAIFCVKCVCSVCFPGRLSLRNIYTLHVRVRAWAWHLLYYPIISRSHQIILFLRRP